MELKDVILSTLAEMEEVGKVNETTLPMKNINNQEENELHVDQEDLSKDETNIDKNTEEAYEEPILNESYTEESSKDENSDNEIQFLTSMRERLLVLFEGFQAPNNTNIEAKVDMTLNFLEYILVTIDNRVQEIEKSSRK